MYRQGDVLVMKVDEVKGELQKRTGRIVLAYGEVTGHAHAIYDEGVDAYVDADNEMYLKVMETVGLRHEEHAPVNIPPGVYKIVRQREYTPEEIRNVAD